MVLAIIKLGNMLGKLNEAIFEWPPPPIWFDLKLDSICN